MTTFIDYHILQSVPPSCINRDDNGSPKTASYGGVSRLRVSSQAWKRATREKFNSIIDRSEQGTRTLQIVELLSDEITQQDAELQEQAVELAETVIKAAGIKLVRPKGSTDPDDLNVSGYLLFLANAQVELLAAEAVASIREEREINKKTVKEILKAHNSIDLSLFGRMVADWPDSNVDASCQVAHAISTHAAETEFDFFTAVDDFKAADADADAGAGMMGAVEFSSATLYRYATINLDQLESNLGTRAAAVRASQAFTRAFITSMPTGKFNTFANATLPAVVLVSIRSDQPVSYVGAFERPVQASPTSGYEEKSVKALAGYAQEIAATYGIEADHSYAIAVGSYADEFQGIAEAVSLQDLEDRLGTDLSSAADES